MEDMFEKAEKQKALRKLWESLKTKGLFSQFANYEEWINDRDRKLPAEKKEIPIAILEAECRAATEAVK
jgi:frataxin-like iron-binding protein CyaY